ncbi:Gfo/Idh/MocA family oxidoreductase [candidate division KSB1 bacterium]|nr:Gfo/Idh/MocA family oxidoreductase [candidate division KSB1 bacterium]
MTFKICTIGCGSLATSQHGPAFVKYATSHPQTELTACCDLVEERARSYKEKFGFRRYYTDNVEMLNREKPDAVCLIAPVDLTCELSCQILQMGYPLLVEKPPGRTPEELGRMIAAAESTGAITQVSFNRRYAPLIREIKSLLAGQLADRPIQYLRYDFYRYNRMDADFSTTAIHGIDAVRFLTGCDYERIQFHYQQFPELGYQVANIFMDCKMTSGAVAHLNFCPIAGVTIERATINALDHTFFLDTPIWGEFDSPGKILHFQNNQLKLELSGDELPEGTETFELSGFYGENAAFFDDLRAGRRPACDLKDARQSVEIAHCIRERKDAYIRS